MIACAFAACSNEDDPIVGPDQPQTGENNATLTISVKNVARSLTKAAAEGTQTENEAKIMRKEIARLQSLLNEKNTFQTNSEK